MDETLINNICMTIAEKIPTDFETVKRNYNRRKSFDILLEAIDIMQELGGSLDYCTYGLITFGNPIRKVLQ